MRFSLPLSLLAHVVVLAAALVMSQIEVDGTLPEPHHTMVAYTAMPRDIQLPPPPPAPPRGERATAVATHSTLAPVLAPDGIAPDSSAGIGVPGGLPGGVPGGVPGGLLSDGTMRFSTPPPSEPTREEPKALRVGGDVRPPEKIHDVRPVYPRAALEARIEGSVILEATISPTGIVEGLRVVKSVPLLDTAAREAVRQWRFKPTLLNGVPVPVLMTVTLHFRLQ
jgi:protein TonB